jgi:hypothetical protein
VATSVKKSKKSSKNTKSVTRTFWFRRFATKKHGIALAFVVVFALIGISMLLLTRAASATGNIKNVAGKCLNNKRGVTTNTNPMQLYRCSTSASQTFTLPGDGTIRIQGKCMDVKGGVLKSGTIVQIYTCTTSRVQKWTVKSNGSIVVGNAPTLCLHNKKDLNVDGNPILIANCHGTRSQKWTVPMVDSGGGGVTSGTWPSTPPAQICGNSVLNGGPTSAPAGAITVPAGNNSSVNFTQNNKTFWFAPGVHYLGSGQYSQITPGSGSTYIGAPGAILDGQHINQYAFTQHATNVRVAYLEIRNFGKARDINNPAKDNEANNNEAVVNHDAGDNWTIEYNNIHNVAGAGVFLGSNNVVRYNCLKDNGQYGFSMYKDPVTNDSSIKNITLDHNEVAGNNTDNWEQDASGNETGCGCTGGGKFWDVKGARVTNNYVHDNKSVALWADTNDIDFLIQGNWIENNDSEAIFYEISYNVTIKDNVIKHNALQSGGSFAANGDDFPESAVYISESGGDSRVSSAITGSPTVTISNNLFLDNWGGITLWENADRYCNSPANTSTGYCTAVNPTVAKISTCTSGNINNAPYKSDCRWKTQNVTISGNEFRITPANVNNCNTAYCGHMAVLSNYGTYPSWSPYKGTVIQQAITFNQNNHWTNNKYYGPWQFVAEETGSLKSWNTWRAAPYGQDAGSTIQ